MVLVQALDAPLVDDGRICHRGRHCVLFLFAGECDDRLYARVYVRVRGVEIWSRWFDLAVGRRAGGRSSCVLFTRGGGRCASSRVVVHHFLLFSFSYPPTASVFAQLCMSSHSLVRDGPPLNVLRQSHPAQRFADRLARVVSPTGRSRYQSIVVQRYVHH